MSKKVPLINASRANRPRNAFDLSQKHLFTAHAGMLLPVMTMDLIPHDHVSIQATDFMRCLPMNSAAFMSMRGVYEFFFVPYSQVWHPFDQFITGMNDYNSSFASNFYNKKTPLKIPSFNRKALYSGFDDAAKAKLISVEKKGNSDIFGYNDMFGNIRLFDLLGYGLLANPDGTPRTDKVLDFINDKESLNPFRLCAYQKIYQDYYRNTTYEPYDVSAFNIDDCSSDIPLSRVIYMSTLRYRNAQLDYFTNLRPTPLFTELPSGLDNGLFAASSLSGNEQSQYENVKNLTVSPHSVSIGLETDTLNVATLRNAFALDKLLQVTQRAGKTYAEQIKAHFGFEVSEGRDGKVNYLGGFDSNIQVGDVTQTAGTSASPEQGVSIKHGGYLGRVTGKAQGSGSGHIEFDAKEHGILMCIYSLVPDMQYDSTRLDPFVVKQTRGDFFMPEFEDLGMQPLQNRFISDHGNQVKDVFKGWQPRYSEYKTALDINHGQFVSKQPLCYWSVGRGRGGETLDTFNISALKINPKWLDSVFAVNYNGSQLTDCCFGGCQFQIQKVSDMSVDGVPRV